MVTPRTQPVELHAHAMDNLKYIRQTMERAGSFTAVPGKGGVLMGAVAVLAAGLAHRQAGASAWLAIWTAAAIVAMAIGILGAALKSRRFRIPLFSGPGRKFVAGFALSDGGPNPYRYRVRPPSLINLTVLEDMCLGSNVADVVLIFGSVDIVLGEVDIG